MATDGSKVMDTRDAQQPGDIVWKALRLDEFQFLARVEGRCDECGHLEAFHGLSDVESCAICESK